MSKERILAMAEHLEVAKWMALERCRQLDQVNRMDRELADLRRLANIEQLNRLVPVWARPRRRQDRDGGWQVPERAERMTPEHKTKLQEGRKAAALQSNPLKQRVKSRKPTIEVPSSALVGIPVKYAGIFKRAYGGKSRGQAVKAKCLECSNFTRSEVTHCTVKQCPLWLYRPYQ